MERGVEEETTRKFGPSDVEPRLHSVSCKRSLRKKLLPLIDFEKVRLS
jgi:hypothetical protein